MNMEISSQELLQRLALDGDSHAWALIVERHGQAMYRAALAVAGSPDRADDAVQEAFLHVRQRAGNFRKNEEKIEGNNEENSEGKVRSWLLQLAANAALHILRAERRRRVREEIAAPTMVVEDTMDNQEQQQEQQINLSHALGQLTSADRQIILLRYTQGLDHPALAQTLGCTEGAVRVRMHRAHERLRKLLKRAGILLSVSMLAERLDAAQWATATPSPLMNTTWVTLQTTSRTPLFPYHLVSQSFSPAILVILIGGGLVLAASLFSPLYLPVTTFRREHPKQSSATVSQINSARNASTFDTTPLPTHSLSKASCGCETYLDPAAKTVTPEMFRVLLQYRDVTVESMTLQDWCDFVNKGLSQPILHADPRLAGKLVRPMKSRPPQFLFNLQSQCRDIERQINAHLGSMRDGLHFLPGPETVIGLNPIRFYHPSRDDLNMKSSTKPFVR